MRNSKINLTVTAAVLAGSVALFSAVAHGEGAGMMAGHSEQNGMMSSQGMEGMGGMMGMMSDMSPEDRKAMTEACMKMMQAHGGDGMKDKDTGTK
ncbi:hypothetical protein SAMN04487869_14210 [Marinobacter sp. DSM 26671]|jgi:hypothetical protein|uniref:Pentapeptide MXKDX repeat protein n=3 Tax=Marinobacter TaxID=2742 RepID=A0A3D8H273_9GAMM|nr:MULTISPECIES: hypothetical protein [Marinobacter]MAM52366.1 hypothetical protein [Marinobacter sp.]HAP51584.1 hypothetical protein [Marinobacter adhaerens]AKV95380.1 hypothetical protein ACP86_03905 [Marinobacter sp. CP1]EHJ03989.1 hypothetical protein KYE_12405 [Marinobacter manganoxydans MnI7-9]MBL3557777.1 hypothetical protein [Marinobacter sp. JB05H06]|tara:strand:- start:567 stop:851 length:285 start_codon:yes stop_codon:yes gene_type:complete